MGKHICSIDGCEEKHSSRGWCYNHYKRWWKYGDPLGGRPSYPKSDVDAFWFRVEKTETCWNWMGQLGGGSRTHGLYGRFRDGRYAHRVAYELLVGNIPDGLFIDHVCHNTRCVNPDHLRAVTPKQNSEHLLGARSDSKSGVRGVSWDGAKWAVYVHHNHRGVNGGSYQTIEEAEQAAIALRNKLFTHNDADRETA